MASVTTFKNGGRAVYVKCPDGKRRPIRLGKVSKKQADSVRHHVEDLASAAMGGYAPASQTAQWLREIGTELYDKLASVGLVQRRERALLGEFLDNYLAGRADTKHGTLVAY